MNYKQPLSSLNLHLINETESKTWGDLPISLNCRTGFQHFWNLGLGNTFLGRGHYPVCCKMFSSYPTLCPPDISSTLLLGVTSKNAPRLYHMSPGEQDLPLAENQCCRVTATRRVWASWVPVRCFFHAGLRLQDAHNFMKDGIKEMKGIIRHQHRSSGIEEIIASIRITLEQLMIEVIYFKPFSNLLSNVYCWVMCVK